jgi:hypothetical protein
MASFISKSPLEKDKEIQRPMGRQIQGGPPVDMGSPMTDLAMQAAPGVADAAFKTGANALAGAGGGTGTLANIGTALGGVAAPTAASAAPVLGAVGTAGGLGAAGAGAGLAAAAPAAAATTGAAAAGAGAAGMAAMAPMLAAAGPFALMALPFLLKNGTPGVPEMDYGPDPLQGYMNGTNRVQGYNNGSLGVAGMAMDKLGIKTPYSMISGALGLNNGIPGVPGLAGMAMDKFGIKSPMSVVGKALGFNDGTNMAYAGGTDSVPAMLTPGEAVIPAAAAQNPNNKPMINSMINEGRQANDMVEGGQIDMTVMSGPLSGKAQREQMQVLQNMSLKKKAAEADEARKQKAFEQKYAHNDMKAMLSMRQS